MSNDAGYVEGDINQVDDADLELDDEYDEELDDGDDDGDEEEPVTQAAFSRDESDEGALSKAVLTHIATALADEPDEVHVETEARGRKVTLRLSVAQPDMGRVIGRRGRTAQAIRALVAAAGAKEGLTTSVDIVD